MVMFDSAGCMEFLTERITPLLGAVVDSVFDGNATITRAARGCWAHTSSIVLPARGRAFTGADYAVLAEKERGRRDGKSVKSDARLTKKARTLQRRRRGLVGL